MTKRSDVQTQFHARMALIERAFVRKTKTVWDTVHDVDAFMARMVPFADAVARRKTFVIYQFQQQLAVN